MSDREKIQIYLSNGYTVSVRRIGYSDLMTAIKFAMLDNGITLEPRFDIILCKWVSNDEFEHTDGFHIDELEIV